MVKTLEGRTMDARSLNNHSYAMNLGMKMLLFPEYYRFRQEVSRAARLSEFDTVLDFGCGIGLLEDFFRKTGISPKMVCGVDSGNFLVQKARKRLIDFPLSSFAVIDKSGRLPFKSGSFSVIITSLVSHLLDRNQKAMVFSEFKRLLCSGGRAVLAELGKPYNLYGKWMEFLSRNLWVRIWPYEKNSFDSYEGRLPLFLSKAGFNNITKVGQMKGCIEILVCTN